MTGVPPPVDVVIVGGGIVGITTAYYLLSNASCSPPAHVTLVEAVHVAHAASGRAMGMIGRDWQGSSTRQLGKLSWQCYEELAAKYGGPEAWDWMESDALGVEVISGAKLSRYRSLPKGVSRSSDIERTFNGEVYNMGSSGVGHFNPRKFCHFVHAECTRLGLKTVYGRPAAIEQQTSLTVTLNDGTAEELPFAGLLLSAGPWTTAVAKKLRLACPLTGNLPGHSIHIAPSPGWSNDFVGKSIFAGITDETEDSVDAIAWSDGEPRDAPGGRGCTPSVELVSRHEGYVYVAGENGTPMTARSGIPDPQAANGAMDAELVDRLCRSAAKLTPLLDIRQGARLVHSQVCYRPTRPGGTPILSRLNGSSSIYIAAGHGPWGITLGPGSGKVMAELIMGWQPSIDMSPFECTAV